MRPTGAVGLAPEWPCSGDPAPPEMPLTLHLRTADPERDEHLALGFDSPRIVIGRAKSSEVLLPDPSVSARHASIRQRGTEYIVMDEGSTNGIQVGSVRLPANTPRVVRHGEVLRIGRVWLEVELGVAQGTLGGARRDGQDAGMRWLERELQRHGRDLSPEVRVVAGPDAGLRLRLVVPGREYVIGRGADADLVLNDPNASRRHLGVTWDGARITVRDLGSKGGSRLDADPLGAVAAEWRAPTEVGAAGTSFALALPLLDAFAEALVAPDERMAPYELDAGPPWLRASTTTTPPVAAPDESNALDPDAGAEEEIEREPADPARKRGGFGPIEVFALLLALGVLGLSAAALAWLFGR